MDKVPDYTDALYACIAERSGMTHEEFLATFTKGGRKYSLNDTPSVDGMKEYRWGRVRVVPVATVPTMYTSGCAVPPFWSAWATAYALIPQGSTRAWGVFWVCGDLTTNRDVTYNDVTFEPIDGEIKEIIVTPPSSKYYEGLLWSKLSDEAFMLLMSMCGIRTLETAELDCYGVFDRFARRKIREQKIGLDGAKNALALWVKHHYKGRPELADQWLEMIEQAVKRIMK